jgi:hypothetical protein
MPMLQAPERDLLQGFFEWLLDTRHFPSLVQNRTKRFLPKIRREIKHLQKLEQEMDRPLQEAIVCLEAHAKAIEAAPRQYSSPYKVRVSGAKGNIEETERVFLATRVARLLKPEESPHSVVRDQLADKSHRRGDRTVEMRVRRFEKQLPSGECDRIAQAMYSDFKYSTFFPEIRRRLARGEWKRNCWQIAEQLAITTFEQGVLKELCEGTVRRRKS